MHQAQGSVCAVSDHFQETFLVLVAGSDEESPTPGCVAQPRTARTALGAIVPSPSHGEGFW